MDILLIEWLVDKILPIGLSMKRKENVELAVIAGMLHDIYSYANMDSQDDAHKGAEMARNILTSLNIY